MPGKTKKQTLAVTRSTKLRRMKAKLATGIHSGTNLKITTDSIAVADDYVEWLLKQRGTVNPKLDLEF
jgi:hypothetical protein